MAAVEESLKAFSRWLKPPEEILNAELATAEAVFRVLKRDKRLNVGRTDVVGSIGKGTAIKLHFDVDCLVLLQPQPTPCLSRDELANLLREDYEQMPIQINVCVNSSGIK